MRRESKDGVDAGEERAVTAGSASNQRAVTLAQKHRKASHEETERNRFIANSIRRSRNPLKAGKDARIVKGRGKMQES